MTHALRRRPHRARSVSVWLLAAASMLVSHVGLAQDPPAPTMTVPNLAVRTAAGGFITPIGLAFLSDDEWLVIEKNTGQVRLLEDGVIGATVLDLAVNAVKERGLLGIALHPDFAVTPYVYLFWSCTAGRRPRTPRSSPSTGRVSRRAPARRGLRGRARGAAARQPGRPLRVGRRHAHLLRPEPDQLRAFQNDAAPAPPGQGDEDQPARGNHDGGVLASDPTASSTSCSATWAAAAASESSLRSDGTGSAPPCRTISSAVPSRTTRTSPGSSCGSTTTARRRPTIRSSTSAPRWAERSAPTSRRSSPTASATASAWPSIRSPATSGTRRTARMPSTSSTLSSRA